MSRNIDVALHVGDTGIELPDTPPARSGYVLTATNVPAPGAGPVQTAWAAAGPSGITGMPTATRAGQVPVAGAGPGFAWAAGDIDMGRF